jgi:hypothetical protein
MGLMWLDALCVGGCPPTTILSKSISSMIIWVGLMGLLCMEAS